MLSSDFNKDVTKTHTKNFPEVEYVHGDASEEKIKSEILYKLRGKKITLWLEAFLAKDFLYLVKGDLSTQGIINP